MPNEVSIVDSKQIEETKNKILSDNDNREIIEELNQNLINIMNPDTNKENYNEMVNIVRTELLNRISSFTSNSMYSDVKTYLGGVINQALSSTLNDSSINGALESSIRSALTQKNGTTPSNELIQSTKESIKSNILNSISSHATRYIDSSIYKLSGSLIQKINGALYSNIEVSNITPIITSFASNMISDTTNTLIFEIGNIIENGELNQDIASTLTKAFNNNLDSLKTSAMYSLNYNINSGISSLTDKVNEKIGNVFCAPRVELTKDGVSLIGGSLQLQNFQIGNILVGKIAGSLINVKKQYDSINKTESINKMKDKLQESTSKSTDGKPKINDNDLVDSNNWTKVPESSANNQTTAKEASSQNQKSNSVKKRNEKNTVAESSKDNKSEKPVPKEETYDNTIPPRASVKADPRRDNCQELVLWEGKEKYVLLRDGIGNYLLLDEDKKCVRLQHTSGSYIQLSSNGNIEIEAAKHIRLNCCGARYIKQF